MAGQETPERAARPPDMIVTSITVADVSQARGHPLRTRRASINARRSARAALAAMVALVAVAAIVVISLPAGRTVRPAERARARELPLRERAAIASALGYPYPLRCLTIAVFADEPSYATAEIDRTNRCARYHGYINATLHRIHGKWRLLLDEGQLYVPHDLPVLSGSSTASSP